jgi:large subunit ribosomal protein L18e
MEHDKVTTMFTHTNNDIKWTLRTAYKKTKTPLWKTLEKKIESSRSNRTEINVGRLENLTKDGENIVIPGKILGDGTLTHKLNVTSFSISLSAMKKILDAGGKVITINDLVNQHPNGTGVRIIG